MPLGVFKEWYIFCFFSRLQIDLISWCRWHMWSLAKNTLDTGQGINALLKDFQHFIRFTFHIINFLKVSFGWKQSILIMTLPFPRNYVQWLLESCNKINKYHGASYMMKHFVGCNRYILIWPLLQIYFSVTLPLCNEIKEKIIHIKGKGAER